MKNKTKRLDGKKKLITLTRKLEDDMSSYCRDKGIESESELIRQAVTKYIYADFEDETLKLQGLKYIKEDIVELHDMINVIFSYLIKMNIGLIAYFPELPNETKAAALASAENRHEKLFNNFMESLKNEPSFFERILHKYYSEI